jgi:hypothetical protein
MKHSIYVIFERNLRKGAVPKMINMFIVVSLSETFSVMLLLFREHKVTQLLKECLSSLTCHAAMIAHVSPAAQHYTDTLATVQLASRIHRMRRRKIKVNSVAMV